MVTIPAAELGREIEAAQKYPRRERKPPYRRRVEFRPSELGTREAADLPRSAAGLLTQRWAV
jgi:hypothetical protein